jgi:hypothetical protein
MRPANMRPADMRSADMRRPEGTPTAACPKAYSAAVSAKPAEMSAATVSAKTVSAAVPAKPAEMSAATVSAKATVPATAVSAATAAAGVRFEGEKRHDEQQHRGHESAGRQHQPDCAAGLGAPHRCGRLSLGILPRTKSF